MVARKKSPNSDVSPVKQKKKGTLSLSRSGNPYINTGGAPSFPWTDELEDEISDYISTHPLSLEQCCAANPKWPKMNAIYERVNKSRRFGEKYLVAKHNQVHTYIDETQKIALEARENIELVPWANMVINLRKWQASRLMPKVYGDKSEQVIVTNDAVLSKENQQLKEMVAKLQAERERDY